MTDDINLVYHNNKLVGIITDDDCFWYMYEWLSESDGVCNAVAVDKKNLCISDDISDFNKMVAKFGSVELKYADISIGVNYDDEVV